MLVVSTWMTGPIHEVKSSRLSFPSSIPRKLLCQATGRKRDLAFSAQTRSFRVDKAVQSSRKGEEKREQRTRHRARNLLGFYWLSPYDSFSLLGRSSQVAADAGRIRGDFLASIVCGGREARRPVSRRVGGFRRPLLRQGRHWPSACLSHKLCPCMKYLCRCTHTHICV